MDPERKPPPGCRDPDRGRTLEAYLEGKLSREETEAFEAHYFACTACLEEIQLRQALPAVLEEERRKRAEKTPAGFPHRPLHTRFWKPTVAVAVGATGLAVLLLAWVLVPHRQSLPQQPVTLELRGIFRSEAEETPAAPPGRPLELVLYLSVPTRQEVTYDVVVSDQAGETVASTTGINPFGPGGIRFLVPEGLAGPGRYHVTVEERVAGEPEHRRFHYSFTVRAGTTTP